MNIVIVGQGAMGLLWYQHIAQNSVKTQLSLLSSSKKNNNTYSFVPFEQDKPFLGKIKYTTEDNLQSADIIIFCLKSYQIESALLSIINNIKPNAMIILAHNGLGVLTELPKHILQQHIILTLLTTHACLRTKPFTIKHTGIGKTDIGLLSGRLSVQEQNYLTDFLNQALPVVEFQHDILEKQWVKLAINAVINPITALNDIKNGEVNNEKFSLLIHAILTEIVIVAKAEGIALIFSALIKKVREVACATAENSSSMRCDLLEKRETEVDYINGYIHQLGLKHKITTPTNSMMWQQIKHLARSDLQNN